MFGRKNEKVKFDARQPPQEFLQYPQNYSFVHNFKVHFKSSVIQALANKVDVSVNTDSPSMPSPQLVTNEFNSRMIMSNAHTDNRLKRNANSFHITNIEYKESMALGYSMSNNSIPRQPQPQVVSSSAFCTNCGNQVALG
jgi:hypothetical protein